MSGCHDDDDDESNDKDKENYNKRKDSHQHLYLNEMSVLAYMYDILENIKPSAIRHSGNFSWEDWVFSSAL